MDQLDTFVDRVLNFLSERLPPPVYSILINVLSHSLALCTASFRLFGSLISKNPEEWDLQSVLPPIITILAAYLALASLYRTTTWLIKLVFWFIKWGSIIGVLSLGAGWLAAVTTMNGGANNGLAEVLSWMSGRSGTASRSNIKTRTSGSVPLYRTKFKVSRVWQYQEGQEAQPQSHEVQKIMQNIVESANQILGGNSWWNLARVAGPQQFADVKEGKTKTTSR